VPTTPYGNVIGDGILFHEAEKRVVFVGRYSGGQLAQYQRGPGETTWTSSPGWGPAHRLGSEHRLGIPTRRAETAPSR